MERVLITGGTGFLGHHLSDKLSQNGYEVALLSRGTKKQSTYPVFTWDPGTGFIDSAAKDFPDYIIHLAGAGIGSKRWSRERRCEIINSRSGAADNLYSAFAGSKKLKAFISASATGYYGSVTSDKIFSEDDQPAGDFLGNTCARWEESAIRFSPAGKRVVRIRTAVVLARDGGALKQMAIPVKLGIGSAIGNGKQYIPWIHLEDLCGIYLMAIENSMMSGAFNAVAPDFRTSKTFTRALAKALSKPFWFPNVPAFVMKALFGEMSDILLKGSRVSPAKIISSGFRFRYPDLESALEEIYS